MSDSRFTPWLHGKPELVDLLDAGWLDPLPNDAIPIPEALQPSLEEDAPACLDEDKWLDYEIKVPK